MAKEHAPGRPVKFGADGALDRPASEADLDFVRKPMVRWLDPHQLLDTAGRVLASGFWSAYTDNRELQAMVPAGVHDRSEASDMWVDYVSDLGDGFNSTYTVAYLLAQPELEVDGEKTRRGRILVMGGDQVYPVPKRSHYENRLLGPYRAAMPNPPGNEKHDLFAIPGSHDWYDGLINFTNIFCRRRELGALRTSQTRSYFAVALPHRWWLWGIDLQFGDFIDEAQVRYFSEIASDAMQEGDRIILCMAKEVDSGPKSAEVCSDRDVRYLEREVVAPAGGRIEVFLKSGRHYYSRYEEEDGRQLITAGGGGAFLHPTHRLPEGTSPHGVLKTNYVKQTVYPSEKVSKRLRKRVFLLPAYNLPLAALLGSVHLLLAILLRLHLEDQYLSLGIADLWHALWETPAAFLLVFLMIGSIGAMVLLAHDASGLSRLALGVVHSILQVGGLVFVFVVASEGAAATGSDGVGSLAVFLLLVWLIGGIGGVLGIGGYFWATNILGYHGNEVYAPLHHEDLKNFLRLHLDSTGDLTIYPVGVNKVGRHWKLQPDAPLDAPWLEPEGDPPAVHLIEPPIRIKGPVSEPVSTKRPGPRA
ncbi:MAG: hypothetical protein QOE93_462 [Actinomycetota bacterium]|nr:hypothetical protein [Actinomycetota bacterium]